MGFQLFTGDTLSTEQLCLGREFQVYGAETAKASEIKSVTSDACWSG